VDVEQAQEWDSRGHFFAAAAEAMRRILVEGARRRARVKHGGGFRRRDVDPDALAGSMSSEDLLALDEALEALAREDALKARLVTLRFFGGLAIEDAARLLGISRATADRHWAYARAWLHRRVTA
jgi:RNA polymerase sigma factor (TIGR02999 family)